jgi:hypothetical protein
MWLAHYNQTISCSSALVPGSTTTLSTMYPKLKEHWKIDPNMGNFLHIGMNHVGHLRRDQDLLKRQNNTNAMSFNNYMQLHYNELGFDGYVCFYNVTRDADQCAQVNLTSYNKHGPILMELMPQQNQIG